jgi:hypothetical protein
MTPYDCDVCGRKCSRTHALVTYGTDTVCCDNCASYDWDAYGEDPDPLLVPDAVASSTAGRGSGVNRVQSPVSES